MMTAFLPPIDVAAALTPVPTVIELGDRTIRPNSEPNLMKWLEANGIDPKNVLVEQAILASEGRIRCLAVDLDEHNRLKLDDSDLGYATKLIDVAMVKAPHEFGL